MSRYPMVALKEALIPSADAVEVQAGVSYPMAGVYGFGRGLFLRAAVSGQSTSYKKFFRVRPGNVVLSRLKAFEGAVAVAGPEHADAFVSSEFPMFAVDANRADITFIHWLCAWSGFWSRLGSRSRGVGARRERLHEKEFLDITIPLPDLPEQRRVAEKLDKFSTRTRGIRQHLARAATVAPAAWWTSLDDRMRSIAARDERLPLDDCAFVNPESVNPAVEFADRSFLYVDISAVGNGTGRIIGPKTVPGMDPPSRARRRIRTNDVLLSTVRPYLRGIARVPPELDGMVSSTGFAVLRAKSHVEPEFLEYQVLSETFIRQLVGEMRGGHYPAVNDRKLRQALLTVPPIAEQREICQFLRPLRGRFQRVELGLRDQANGIRRLERSLLDRAFAGDL